MENPEVISAFMVHLIPIALFGMVLGIVVAGIWSGIRFRAMQSQERLAAIAAGIPIPPTVEELAILHGKPQGDRRNRRSRTRLTGIILLASAAGLIAFFTALAFILTNVHIFIGAAVGLIPLFIGLGFLIDARIQKRELETLKDEPTNLASTTDTHSV